MAEIAVHNERAPSNTFEEASDWFMIQSIGDKTSHLAAAIAKGLAVTSPQKEFALGRDVRVVSPAELPRKTGLSTALGQARLLHDLASIELQAMELAVRGLYEFPEAPQEFRDQLSELAFSEGRHLELCLKGLGELGIEWGHWDVHIALWNAVNMDDSLLDRILIVHRYLEGAGLDAGESILRRLQGVGDKSVRRIVQTIMGEEIAHVRFGSDWYRKVAAQFKIDPEEDFRSRIGRIFQETPRREKLAHELRYQAGFSDFELRELERVKSAHRPSENASIPREVFRA